MLCHKNSRFYCKGISFKIPDGYFLDTYHRNSW